MEKIETAVTAPATGEYPKAIDLPSGKKAVILEEPKVKHIKRVQRAVKELYPNGATEIEAAIVTCSELVEYDGRKLKDYEWEDVPTRDFMTISASFGSFMSGE